MWHVSNEYGTYCYCPTCQAKFRLWLRRRYGTLEELNRRWHTSFWGRVLTSFEEVTLPTELNDDYRFNPAIQLDYMRFVTDSTAECFMNEYQVLKKYNPEIPIQTNMSGYIKKLDQFTSVSYTHLTLPTIYSVYISVVAVSLKKKTAILGLSLIHNYHITSD